LFVDKYTHKPKVTGLFPKPQIEFLFPIEFSGAIRKLAGGEFAGGFCDILLFFA
jgi:hypothetical protein